MEMDDVSQWPGVMSTEAWKQPLFRFL